MRGAEGASGSTPWLVEAQGLTKHFPLKGTFRARSRGAGRVHAVSAVDLRIRRGEIVGLVGESGCGKTTLGKMLVRLIEPTSGSILFDGKDITRAVARDLAPFRRRMQIIFQDPYGSLNPRATIASMLGEVIRFHHIVPEREVGDEIDRLLEIVGLHPDAREKYPHEFSGGQRQRIVIARALAVRPEFILADEPVSALDVSIRAQILNLLADLRDRFGLALLVITHDLSVVEHFCDRANVMVLGRIVETLPSSDLGCAKHPYSRALLEANPVRPTTEDGTFVRRAHRVLLSGDIPSPVHLPSGCAFRHRCPNAEPGCAEAVPPLVTIDEGHQLACPVVARASGGAASSTVSPRSPAP